MTNQIVKRLAGVRYMRWREGGSTHIAIKEQRAIPERNQAVQTEGKKKEDRNLKETGRQHISHIYKGRTVCETVYVWVYSLSGISKRGMSARKDRIRND